MAINTQTIRIDLNTGRTIPVAFAHQNDTNRQLTFQLYNNGVAFTPSSTTVKFAYKSPIVNGRYSVITGSQMASGTVSGNTVTVTLPAQYTQVSGVGLLTMILTTSGNTLRPVNIKFVCQGSADGDDTVLGASDWPEGLYDYMDNWLEENEPTEIANLKSDLYDKTSDIFAYAVGTINSNNGTNGTNSQRIRIEEFLDIEQYKIISINTGYDLSIFAYREASVESYLGTTSWLSEKSYYTKGILDAYPSAKYIRFVFRSHVERDMTIQDVTTSSISIYEDRYATNEDLNATNERLEEETKTDGEIIECSFVQGSISSNNGRIDTTRNDRIADETFYATDDLESVTCDDGFKILLANYSSDTVDTFINVTGWLSPPITEFASSYIRVVVKKDDDSSITPEEATNTKIKTKGIPIKTYVQSLGKPLVNSLCPNIIWQCRNVTNNICPPFSKDYVKFAVENEFDRIIVYVRKTTDGHYVSIHDDTINTEARNLDGSIISTDVSSNNQTLETLNSYDWGIKYGSQFVGMGVPMVEDVMKWAAQYNIACTVHFSYAFTQQDAENIFAMACKYSIVDKMIVLPCNGMDFTRMGYFKDLNEYISYYVGCTYDNLVANMDSIKGLLTGRNDVYVQPYPWGTIVDDSYRLLAKKNNLKLFNSTVMSQNDLFNVVGFDKGYSIIETANIKNIKTTVRNHINS